MDVAARGLEDGVEGIEVAVAGDDAAERLVFRVRGAHGHAVGEPCAAADEEGVRAESELAEAVEVEGGRPTGGARGGIADLAIGGESEVEGNVRFHGEMWGGWGKGGLLFAAGGYPYSFPVAEPTV